MVVPFSHAAFLDMTDREEFVSALVAQLPGLRRYAVALAGDATAADDLVQDSIEKALRQAGQLRDLERMAAWLRRILHNLYVDGIRSDRSHGKREDIEDLVDHLDLSTPPVDSSQTRDFLRAINALSVEHREILLLVGLEDLTYEQVSRELGIPLGTVMSRLARARERLRTMIESGTTAQPRPSATREKS
jgi:RNA polymerase sigma-70 factor, ECF subfamily